MSETTLYRKYRPQAFEQVLGQEHISSTLAGQIENNRFSHAYLFAGSRGTGKTSIARIFAEKVGVEPRDLYEIDAASNRRIDDIRELRQSIPVLPFASPYKVYIIDEAHMLTGESFNALLKSLEEPPAHVIFILATTELSKIPDTIQSRCEIHHFKKPDQKTLAKLVTDVAQKENVEVSSEAAELIALLGEGAFRDTLGTLQKILTASDTNDITVEHVSRLTGAPQTQRVNDFLEALGEGKLADALEVLHEIEAAGNDISIFLELAISKIRRVLLLRFAPELKEGLVATETPEEVQFLETFAKNKTAINSKILSELLGAQKEMKNAATPSLPIELALIRTFGQDGEQ